jgi:pyruvate ferredoxin oxidoreductase gamma subunit
MEYEVRFHGLGGEGVVKAAEMLARAAMLAGGWSQSFPFFGTEVRNAPVKAFTRLSDRPVRKRCYIYAPDIVVVTNHTVLTPDVIADLRDDTRVIINAPGSARLPEMKGAVTALDAITIGYQVFNRPIVNTIVLGAMLKVSPIFPLDLIFRVIDSEFGGELAAKNKRALQAGYDAIEGGV